LAATLVVSVAGSVFADTTDPHAPKQPDVNKPTVEQVFVVSSADVKPIGLPDAVSNDVKVGESMPTTPAEVVAALDKVISGGSFTSADIIINDKPLAEGQVAVTPVGVVPMTVSSDALKAAGVEKLVIEVPAKSTSFKGNPGATLRAKKDATVKVEGKDVAVKTGNWYGEPIVTAAWTSDAKTTLRLTIYGYENFFSAADVVLVDIQKVEAPAPASSGGGCNVGFAPLALLLAAPLFFLKK
ncbi:MAG: SYNERG-CTERM sorting domain-containing protein, partial [Synergistales bacterium]|nr:SYNERG-CTERM sorting domain-containing protein [Synergistales bacterium]